MSVACVDDAGMVDRSKISPPESIEITLGDQTTIQYRLGSLICHSGENAAGHYWTHLHHGTGVIKAEDKKIKPLSLENAKTETDIHGCIYFYVECNEATCHKRTSHEKIQTINPSVIEESMTDDCPDKVTKEKSAVIATDVCYEICTFTNPPRSNNCWMNSTLQGLLNLQIVQDKLSN